MWGSAYTLYAFCVVVNIQHMHIGSSLLCHTYLFRDMAESSQDLLRSAWLEGKDGAHPKPQNFTHLLGMFLWIPLPPLES